MIREREVEFQSRGVTCRDRDSVAPPGPTLADARSSARCETKRYPYGHFDIYTDAAFDEVTADQIAFLQRVAPLGAAP